MTGSSRAGTPSLLLINHQGVICCVAFPPEADKRSFLLATYRSYDSVVTPPAHCSAICDAAPPLLGGILQAQLAET